MDNENVNENEEEQKKEEEGDAAEIETMDGEIPLSGGECKNSKKMNRTIFRAKRMKREDCGRMISKISPFRLVLNQIHLQK